MAKPPKCSRCRRKLVHRKCRIKAADGTRFIACSCGLQWAAPTLASRPRIQKDPA